MIRKILYGLGIVFVILQFFRPAKNTTNDKTNSLEQMVEVPQPIHQLLSKACYDCHSNNTRYPWYTEIQPLGWWIAHHVNEGKEELNFDVFKAYKPKKQDHKLEECIEMIQNDEMPLSSYTLIHGDAKLSNEEKKLLINWFKLVRKQINW